MVSSQNANAIAGKAKRRQLGHSRLDAQRAFVTTKIKQNNLGVEGNYVTYRHVTTAVIHLRKQATVLRAPTLKQRNVTQPEQVIVGARA